MEKVIALSGKWECLTFGFESRREAVGEPAEAD